MTSSDYIKNKIEDTVFANHGNGIDGVNDLTEWIVDELDDARDEGYNNGVAARAMEKDINMLDQLHERILYVTSDGEEYSRPFLHGYLSHLTTEEFMIDTLLDNMVEEGQLSTHTTYINLYAITAKGKELADEHE